MRGLSSFAVMLVVLLGLGSYIYLYQWKQPPIVVEKKVKAVEIKQDQIEQFVIKPASGEASTISKNDGEWKITAPIAAPADDTQMTQLVSLVTGLEVTRVVEENPADLAEFGLSPPQGEITITTSGGSEPTRVRLGGKAPVGNAVYAQISPSPRVILVDGGLKEASNKSPLELRNNGIFTINRDKIDTLEIEAGGHSVQLVKQDLDWELKKPLATRGDLGEVSQLLTSLMSQKMESIVETPVANSPAYRLNPPVATVTIASGDTRETLQVGAKKDAANLYARNSSRPMVFTIPSSLLDELKNDPARYRRKDVFDFQTIDATRLEVVANGQTTVYAKATGKGADGKWHELSPNARVLDQAQIDSALSRLSYLRAVAFVPTPAGFTSGSGVTAVLVKYDEGKKSELVRLAKPGSDAFAVRDDWPDAAKLDGNAYGLLIASLDQLQK
jgi:uncharacterized protein DUF4340